MKQHLLLYLGRALFAGLVIFEFLNWIKILNFSLEFTWLGLLLTSGAVWLGAELVTRRFSHEHLSLKAKGLTFIGAAIPIYADALADINRWYGGIQYYDKYMHFLGGAAAAGLVTLVVRAHAKRKKPSFIVSDGWAAWISFFISISLGVLYELEEYLEDFFTGSHRSGGGPDTAGDMLYDTLGAMIVVFVAWLVWKRNRKKI